MRRRLARRLAVTFLGALALACTSRAAEVPPPDPAPQAANPWSDPTRELLAQHCGKCHRGDLASAPARALLVFNLSEERWYAHLGAEQLDGILTRLRATKALDPGDVAVVTRFVECARDGRCATESPAAP